ncbi:MAG: carbohydrate ABC transporter permease [Clostridiales bacterium]|jgi:putative aldouronate transport system permease protein|nr:carbohydrate ABC transporter permease [Clostridiales bacterium]
MARKISKGRIAFQIVNYALLGALALSCFLPVVHMLAVSLSDKIYAEPKLVGLIPKGFTLGAYRTLFAGRTFSHALLVSVIRTLAGTAANVVLTVLLAYPLSKNSREFPFRAVYMTLCLIVMVFNAGLVPNYLFLNGLGLFDTVWVLILPGAAPVFSAVLMMNFMRALPKDIEEAAMIDGAGYFRMLAAVVAPLSLPSIATVSLFAFVGHWNSWFDGLLYNRSMDHYPLQTYLQVVLTARAPSNIDSAATQVGQNLKAAQIFIAMVPLLLVYPFAQRFFVTGITMGSVKG